VYRPGSMPLAELLLKQGSRAGLPPVLYQQMLDFVSACLQWDPRTRISASDALNHPFLLESETLQLYVPAPAPVSLLQNPIMRRIFEWSVFGSGPVKFPSGTMGAYAAIYGNRNATPLLLQRGCSSVEELERLIYPVGEEVTVLELNEDSFHELLTQDNLIIHAANANEVPVSSEADCEEPLSMSHRQPATILLNERKIPPTMDVLPSPTQNQQVTGKTEALLQCSTPEGFGNYEQPLVAFIQPQFINLNGIVNNALENENIVKSFAKVEHERAPCTNAQLIHAISSTCNETSTTISISTSTATMDSLDGKTVTTPAAFSVLNATQKIHLGYETLKVDTATATAAASNGYANADLSTITPFDVTKTATITSSVIMNVATRPVAEKTISKQVTHRIVCKTSSSTSLETKCGDHFKENLPSFPAVVDNTSFHS
jgi:hypothetical protein